MTLRRLLGAAALCTTLGLGFMGPATADPAGATNYQSIVVSVLPPVPEISVDIVGGDSFVMLTINDPVEVIVHGYEGEPYLMFRPDGSVIENQRSRSTWLNKDRYGVGAVPTDASANANPLWRQVASDGRYAWHDHRAHWMNPVDPPGAEPGDQVLEATIPLLVNQVSVSVTVASYLLAAPSPWPWITLSLATAAGAILVARFGRLHQMLLAVTLGSVALFLGVVAYRSVPPETAPVKMLWVLPIIACGSALFAIALRHRVATTVYPDGLGVSAGLCLLGWALLRTPALSKAIVPSDAPVLVDRAAITACLAVGAITVVIAFAGLLRPRRLAALSPRPEPPS